MIDESRESTKKMMMCKTRLNKEASDKCDMRESRNFNDSMC